MAKKRGPVRIPVEFCVDYFVITISPFFALACKISIWPLPANPKASVSLRPITQRTGLPFLSLTFRCPLGLDLRIILPSANSTSNRDPGPKPYLTRSSLCVIQMSREPRCEYNFTSIINSLSIHRLINFSRYID